MTGRAHPARVARRALRARRCTWCATRLPWWRWSAWCPVCVLEAPSPPCPRGARLDVAAEHAVARWLATRRGGHAPTVGEKDYARALLLDGPPRIVDHGGSVAFEGAWPSRPEGW